MRSEAVLKVRRLLRLDWGPDGLSFDESGAYDPWLALHALARIDVRLPDTHRIQSKACPLRLASIAARFSSVLCVQLN